MVDGVGMVDEGMGRLNSQFLLWFLRSSDDESALVERRLDGREIHVVRQLKLFAMRAISMRML